MLSPLAPHLLAEFESFYCFLPAFFCSSSNAFFLASSGFWPDAFAASSNVLLVMFFGLPISSSGFWHPQL